VVDINFVNSHLQKSFKNTQELYFKGLEMKEEKKIREMIDNGYSLSPIIVLDKIPNKLEVYIEAISYKDVKEELVLC